MLKMYDDMQKTTNANVDEAMRSFEGATKVTQAIASQIADYSKRSFEHGTKTMENLLSAKSLDKAIEVQTEYAKAAYEGYVSHARKPGEKPKMHPPFEFGLARPSPITVIDQERSKHACERDEDQPGPAHSGRLSWEVADSWRERRSRSSSQYDACEWHHQHCGFGAALSSRGTDDTE